MWALWFPAALAAGLPLDLPIAPTPGAVVGAEAGLGGASDGGWAGAAGSVGVDGPSGLAARLSHGVAARLGEQAGAGRTDPALRLRWSPGAGPLRPLLGVAARAPLGGEAVAEGVWSATPWVGAAWRDRGLHLSLQAGWTREVGAGRVALRGAAPDRPATRAHVAAPTPATGGGLAAVAPSPLDGAEARALLGRDDGALTAVSVAVAIGPTGGAECLAGLLLATDPDRPVRGIATIEVPLRSVDRSGLQLGAGIEARPRRR